MSLPPISTIVREEATKCQCFMGKQEMEHVCLRSTCAVKVRSVRWNLRESMIGPHRIDITAPLQLAAQLLDFNLLFQTQQSL